MNSLDIPKLSYAYDNYIYVIKDMIYKDAEGIRKKHTNNIKRYDDINKKRDVLLKDIQSKQVKELDNILDKMLNEIKKGNYPNIKVAYNNFQLIVFTNAIFTSTHFVRNEWIDPISFSMFREFISSYNPIVYIDVLHIPVLEYYKYYNLNNSGVLKNYPICIDYIKVYNIKILDFIPLDVEGLYLDLESGSKEINTAIDKFKNLKRLIIVSIRLEKLVYAYEHLEYLSFVGLDIIDILGRGRCCSSVKEVDLNGSNLKYVNISGSKLSPLSFPFKSIKEIVWNNIENQTEYYKNEFPDFVCNMAYFQNKSCIGAITLVDPFKIDPLPLHENNDVIEILKCFGIEYSDDRIVDTNNVIKEMQIRILTCPILECKNIKKLSIEAKNINVENIKECTLLIDLELSAPSKYISFMNYLLDLQNIEIIKSFKDMVKFKFYRFNLSDNFTLEGLNKLEEVDLSIRHFKYSKELFAGITSLKKITINYSNIIDGMFDDLNIESLILKSCSGEISNKLFEKLNHLKYLYLDEHISLNHNIFKDSPILNTLETLIILNNDIVKIPYVLKDFKKLYTLKAFHKDKEFHKNFLFGVTSLRSLYMNYDENISLFNLDHLTTLRIKILKEGEEVINPSFFLGLDKLENLNLRSVVRSTFIVNKESLNNLTNLKNINAYYTNFHNDAFLNNPSLINVIIKSGKYPIDLLKNFISYKHSEYANIKYLTI